MSEWSSSEEDSRRGTASQRPSAPTPSSSKQAHVQPDQQDQVPGYYVNDGFSEYNGGETRLTETYRSRPRQPYEEYSIYRNPATVESQDPAGARSKQPATTRTMDKSGDHVDFYGQCHNCRGWGHSRTSCPSKPGSASLAAEASANKSEGGGGRVPLVNSSAGYGGYVSMPYRQARSNGGVPYGGGGRGIDRGCFRCGSTDHWKDECPTNPIGGTRRDFGGGQGVAPLTQGRFYVPVAEATEDLFRMSVSTGINFKKHQDVQVDVTGNGAEAFSRGQPTFASFRLRKILVENIEKCGYSEPTPVQQFSIPIILSGRDLMCCAQTGSGKTAAFVLPILHKLLEDGTTRHKSQTDRVARPEALIIAPTRELAIQINNECRKFAFRTYLRILDRPLVGQTCRGQQKAELEKDNVDLVVGTCGRILDFIYEGKVSLDRIRFLVVDEADRMLARNSMHDIEDILKHQSMPPREKRQTLMYSATFPDPIQKLAMNILNFYLFCRVGVVGAANTDVSQKLVRIPGREKRDKLIEMLRELRAADEKRILIFVSRKKSADFLGGVLCEEGFKATTIHGDREQREREIALGDFRTGRMPILVSSDVTARGIDIAQIDHVVNFDLPRQGEMDQYIHRIGRTGRVGNQGTSTSFYDPEEDWRVAKDLVHILSQAQQEVPPWLVDDSRHSLAGGVAGFGGYSTRDMRRNPGRDSHYEYLQMPETEKEELWGR